MEIRLVTWNINSIRIRLEALARVATRLRPDVLCLQETKVADDDFPGEAAARLGFAHQLIRGDKGYNGVAILSRIPLEAGPRPAWCGSKDARHLSARLRLGGRPIELHNFYVPAGGDIPDPDDNDKFAHKLQFLDEMAAWSAALARRRTPLILVGDLNVAPLKTDVWSHTQLLDVVSHTPTEVERLTRIMSGGRWTDAVRHFIPPSQRLYSWWSYRARDWRASDRGRRLDHIWVSPSLLSGLSGATVLRAARSWARPSDHVPVAVTLRVAD